MPSTASRPQKTARRAATAAPRVRSLAAPEVKKTVRRVSRRWVPEQRVIIPTSWKGYLAIDKAFGEDARPGLLLNYSNGLLEIISTSLDHERIQLIISSCIEHYCRESGTYFAMQGRMTRRASGVEKAAEADASYSFVRGPQQPVQLALEVALTSGGIDKLPLYARLGHPEVWIWSRGKIQVYVWSGAAYQRQITSSVLPKLPLTWLEELSAWSDDFDAVTEFRRRLTKKSR